MHPIDIFPLVPAPLSTVAMLMGDEQAKKELFNFYNRRSIYWLIVKWLFSINNKIDVLHHSNFLFVHIFSRSDRKFIRIKVLTPVEYFDIDHFDLRLRLRNEKKSFRACSKMPFKTVLDDSPFYPLFGPQEMMTKHYSAYNVSVFLDFVKKFKKNIRFLSIPRFLGF
ncbi:MAG: hypothetical protein EHM58_16530 [Ignavibacteriae bacterium]|nr:MAG: hypothetical protein EHM58_16530 [Ignavibacteriota bacterium]